MGKYDISNPVVIQSQLDNLQFVESINQRNNELQIALTAKLDTQELLIGSLKKSVIR